MQHARIVKVFSLLLLAQALAIVANSQQESTPGAITPFTTLEVHEYDSINLSNLQLLLTIPVRNKSGHIPYSYEYIGSPNVTKTNDVISPNNWMVYYNAFPSLQGVLTNIGGSLTYTNTQTKNCAGYQNLTGWGNWLYIDVNGGAHSLNFPYIWPYAACGATSASGYTTDGSGIYVSLQGQNLQFTTTDINGNTTNGGTYTDPNGNWLSVTRDTLNQTPLTVSAGSATWKDALGNNQSTSLAYTQMTLDTTFGCTWNSNGGPSSFSFPTAVNYPDGTSLKLGWEKNYANSSHYTGRLASLTLPTGGEITYTYSGGTNGIDCDTGFPVTVTRQTPDGTWTYAAASGATTVTDPQGNSIVYTFTGALLPEQIRPIPISNPLIQEKQSYTNGTLTQTVYTCYNDPSSSPSNCNTSGVTMPITEKDEFTAYPGVTGYATVRTAYDSYGRVTDIKKYDFNASTPINEEQFTYGTGSPSSQSCSQISTYILGKVCSDTLLDSQNGNAILKQKWNQYNSNGNLTETWDLVSGSGSTGTYLSRQYSYNSSGIMQTSTDVNGEVTNYTTTSCNGMFATSQYPTDFSNLGTSQTWDCNGGVETSTTDANSQTTSTLYYQGTTADPFYRPVGNEDPLGNITTITYTPATSSTPATSDTSLPLNVGMSVIESLATKDSIGRSSISQLRQGPGSSNWDSKSRTFDSDGREYEESLPCVANGSSGCSPSTESQTYDAINRPLVHTGTGGDVVTKQYIKNDVLTTLTPVPSGENAKAAQKEFDGLGRLKSMCIVSSAQGSASCGQANSKTGFLTKYSYDAAGRLKSITENAQVSSPHQVRSYTYDLIGRVVTETNPESGTITNTYDTVSGTNCTSTSKGDLVQTVDANGNTTCIHYDKMHRKTSVTYAGPNSNGVNKHFVYDSATVNGVSMTYAEGRMAEAYTCSGSCTSKITDEGFSYDQRGSISAYYQSSPNSGGYYSLAATYWEDKSLKTVSGVGLPTITYTGLDGEARVTQVTAGSTTLVSNVLYNNTGSMPGPIGALQQVVLGSGDSQLYTYDPNTGRMTSYQAIVGTIPQQFVSGSLFWNANGTLSSLLIQDEYNSADNQDCQYYYDDFIRASSVNCTNGSTTVWTQSFTYGSDAFGNLTKSSSGPGISWMPGYNSANNHYTLSGTTYDSDGNLLTDTFHTYTWLADGHIATVATYATTATITYDALGNKVEENIGGTIHEYVSAFGISAQMTNQTENSTIVPLPGGVQALFSGGALQRYRFPDWQGTIRSESNPSTRAFTESLAFAPFGERYATKGAPYNVDSFTGHPDQIASDEYDFDARELHNGQGRWISPDPLSGPGNKYAYANNNPLSNVDLGGLLSVEDYGVDWAGRDSNFLAPGASPIDGEAWAEQLSDYSQNSPPPRTNPESSGEPSQTGPAVTGPQPASGVQQTQQSAPAPLLLALALFQAEAEPDREIEDAEPESENPLEPVSIGTPRLFGPDNPGPLSPAVTATFMGGKYAEITIEGEGVGFDNLVYRNFGGRADTTGKEGTFYSLWPLSPLQNVMDAAVAPEWGNTAENSVCVYLRAGTTVYVGLSAPQTSSGWTFGGTTQIYVPSINASMIGR